MESYFILSLFLGVYEYLTMIKCAEYDFEDAGISLLKCISPMELLRDYRFDSSVKYRSFKILIRTVCNILGFFGLILCSYFHDIYYIYSNNESFTKHVQDKYHDENDEDDHYNKFYADKVDQKDEIGEQMNVSELQHIKENDIELNKLAHTDSVNNEDYKNCYHIETKDIKIGSHDTACILIHGDIDYELIMNSLRNINIKNIYIGKYEKSKLCSVERSYTVDTGTIYHILRNNIDDALFMFWRIMRLNKSIDNPHIISLFITNDEECYNESKFNHIGIYIDQKMSSEDISACIQEKFMNINNKSSLINVSHMFEGCKHLKGSI